MIALLLETMKDMQLYGMLTAEKGCLRYFFNCNLHAVCSFFGSVWMFYVHVIVHFGNAFSLVKITVPFYVSSKFCKMKCFYLVFILILPCPDAHFAGRIN